MGKAEEGAKKNKVAILGISSIVLVAAVVGTVTYGMGNKNASGTASGGASPAAGGGSGVSSSTKSVKSICSHVDYQQTCENSLSNAGNTSDPKELVKIVFQVAVDNLHEVIKNSTLLKNAASDPKTSKALETCEYLLYTSIGDFKRSFDKVDGFDISKVDEYVSDLKTWLSGAITYQQTCLDGFDNTTGDTGEKMRQLLKTASELTSNGLAMVSEFSSIINSLGLTGFNRRLMSTDDNSPDFVDSHARRLLQTPVASLKPNAVVAKDGSGTVKTFKEAIDAVPVNNTAPYVILVKAGVYTEIVEIPKSANHVYIFGEGTATTKITGSQNYVDGVPVFNTSTVAINGDGCILKDITIENSAGPEKNEAVALRVSGDKSIIYNCKIDGYQDTLYSHAYRQYYRDTTISGTIDFIFGDAQAIFQNCTMVVRKPIDEQACTVTAQGRNESRSVTATIMQGCSIVAAPEFVSAKPPFDAYLGRPWKQYSRTIIMQTDIGGFISPDGWTPWIGTWGLDTLYYGEYQNKGAGADTSKRVTWKGIQKITPEIAQSFTPATYFLVDDWITSTGIPYEPSMWKA